jgi:antitoxin CcdA
MRSIQQSPKRPINLTLNAKVLDMAKDMGMNISQTVDALLTEAVLKEYWQRWQHDNAAAIADYNERIEREGLFSDRYRSFMRDGTDRDAA